MELLFSLSFLAVAPIWLLLLAGPAWQAGLRAVARPWIYAPLAVVYTGLVVGALPVFVATFSAPDLGSVQAFVATGAGVTIGWVHWLVFDAFVGRWMVLDAREQSVPHLAVVPCLVLTFFAGPAGFLAYLGVRTALRRRGAARTPTASSPVGST